MSADWNYLVYMWLKQGANVSRVVTNMPLNKWVDLLKKEGENDGRYGIAAKVRIKIKKQISDSVKM